LGLSFAGSFVSPLLFENPQNTCLLMMAAGDVSSETTQASAHKKEPHEQGFLRAKTKDLDPVDEKHLGNY